ncbi:MAG: hypothetical protein R3F65_26625 [bacterium]
MAQNDHAFALLIGIDDYTTFDPSGAADLRGARADVVAWWAQTRALGIPAANVRICAGPALTPDALGADAAAAKLTGATRAEIEAALSWLAGALGESGNQALLTYSGNGARTATGDVICPSDVRRDGDTLADALSLADVGALLGKRAPRTRIIACVDTGHTPGRPTAATAKARSLPPIGAVSGASDPAGHGVFGDIVLSSSLAGTPTYELPLGAGVRGAFSWAAETLLGRWTTPAAGSERVGLTYGDLADRAAALFTPLGLVQTPVYLGLPQAARWWAFAGFDDPQGGGAAPAAISPLEIWPGDSDGRVVQFKLATHASGGTQLGTLYVTDGSPPSGKGWDSDRLYWDWTASSFPTSTFYAVFDGESTGNAPTTAIVYAQSALPPDFTGSSTSIPAGHYKVSQTRHLGYAQATSTALTIYASNAGASALAAGFDTLEFNHSSSSTSDVIYETAVDPKQ